MNAAIDFPPLPAVEVAADEAPTQRTDIAIAAGQSIDIEKVDLKKLALARFGDWRKVTAETKADFEKTVLDLKNQARVDEAKSLRARKINVPLAAARATAKGLKSKLSDTSKAVGGELELIEAAWNDVDSAITPQIEAAQQKLDDAKAEAARIEAERVQKHQARIDIIRSYLGHAQQPGMTSERIAGGMAVLAAQTFPKSEWEEFDVQAANAQCETLEAMRVLHAQVLGREQEAARQEAIRLENERQAEINRLERERIAAELAEIRRATEALEAEKAAARAAELQRQQEAEARAESDRLEKLAEERRAQQAATTYPSGAPMFSSTHVKENGDLMMLDEQGKRSVFCDVDEGQGSQQEAAPGPAAVLVTYDADTNKFAASAFPRVGAMGAGQAADAAPVEPTRVLAALTCEGRGIYLTGYLPEAKFDEIKAIFLNATQGVTK